MYTKVEGTRRLVSLPDLETSGVSCVPKLPNRDEVVFGARTSGRPLGTTMAGYPVGAYGRLTLAGRGIPTLIHLYQRSIIIIDPSIGTYRLHKKTHYKGCNGRTFPRFGENRVVGVNRSLVARHKDTFSIE